MKLVHRGPVMTFKLLKIDASGKSAHIEVVNGMSGSEGKKAEVRTFMPDDTVDIFGTVTIEGSWWAWIKALLFHIPVNKGRWSWKP